MLQMKAEAFNKLQEDIMDIFLQAEVQKVKEMAIKMQSNKPKNLKEVFFPTKENSSSMAGTLLYIVPSTNKDIK